MEHFKVSGINENVLTLSNGDVRIEIMKTQAADERRFLLNHAVFMQNVDFFVSRPEDFSATDKVSPGTFTVKLTDISEAQHEIVNATFVEEIDKDRKYVISISANRYFFSKQNFDNDDLKLNKEFCFNFVLK